MPKLLNIRLVLWDVYGTLLRAPRGDVESLLQRETELRPAFENLRRRFRLRLDAALLQDVFVRSLMAERSLRQSQGTPHPEVRVDEIWFRILEKIAPQPPTLNYAREVALAFEAFANPKTLMPGAFDTLRELRHRGLRQGLISNAQFYTPIEISTLLRDASSGAIGSYESLFDLRFVFFSYQLGVSKPDPAALHLATERLAAEDIQPGHCVMVGDSVVQDIEPARQQGLRTVWFTPAAADTPSGDPGKADAVIHQLPELLELL